MCRHSGDRLAVLYSMLCGTALKAQVNIVQQMHLVTAGCRSLEPKLCASSMPAPRKESAARLAGFQSDTAAAP